MTAYDNVLLPLELQEVDDKKASNQVKKILIEVGLGDKMNNLPSQLSGGQQQRVAIARALVNDPEVILADEPTGNLDSKTGINVMNFLQKLHEEKGKTIVMVTHDLNLAQYAHRLVELKDGKIVREEENKKIKKIRGVGK